MNLLHVTVTGSERAERVAVFLISVRSTYFQLMPLPDDQWQFSVKQGEGHIAAIEALFR